MFTADTTELKTVGKESTPSHNPNKWESKPMNNTNGHTHTHKQRERERERDGTKNLKVK